MLPEEAYKDLEEAVGPENVSREPGVLDGYAWQPTYNQDPEKWVPRPVAVALPSSIEEVQAVVRACNRHDLKFKAFSTGWGPWAGPTTDGVVQIDLRRMNRILEIDERNMYAVVEPYVSGAQLQAEAMKVGLNAHIIGAGPACSPLASATSMQGTGWDGIYMGHSARHVLGVEWVLPDGEVLRLGTLGSGVGWFSGDGPGPSLRGIMRGEVGALGGIGVFTKCAIKLFCWPGGPPLIKTDGMLLDTQSEIPENMGFHMCLFPDKKRIADALYKIGEAEIGYNNIRIAPGALMYCFSPHLFHKLTRTSALRSILSEALKYAFVLPLKADSDEEMEYQEKALRKIVSEKGGLTIDVNKLYPLGSMLIMNFLRATVIPLVFRTGGLFGSTPGKDDAFDAQLDWAEDAGEIKRKWIERGGMIDDMVYNPFMLLYENNLWSHYEEIFLYDARDKKQLDSLVPIYRDFLIAMVERCKEPILDIDPQARKLMSPMLGNFSRWQSKISDIFDPAGAADATLYSSEEDFDLSSIGDVEPKKLEGLMELIASRTWTESGPPE